VESPHKNEYNALIPLKGIPLKMDLDLDLDKLRDAFECAFIECND